MSPMTKENVSLNVEALSLEQEFHLFNPHLATNYSENQYLVHGVLLPSISVLGLVFNSGVISVLWCKNQQVFAPSLSLLLQWLAAYDMCVAVLSMWMYSLPTLAMVMSDWVALKEYLTWIHPHVSAYVYSLLQMAITGSDYLNLAAAVERYTALEGEFRKKKSPQSGCAPRTAWTYVLGILTVTVAFNLPIIWERKVVLNNSTKLLEVLPSSLRHDAIYVKLYRLTLEFLVFKATPWVAFLILFLSLKDRLRYYCGKKSMLRTLTPDQYVELMDSRIILGINALFYVTNVLPLYISLAHILLFHVEKSIIRAAHLCIVVNSSLKFLVYLALSIDFREAIWSCFLCSCFRKRDGRTNGHWMIHEKKNHEFLYHAKVVTFVQADSKASLQDYARVQPDSLS